MIDSPDALPARRSKQGEEAEWAAGVKGRHTQAYQQFFGRSIELVTEAFSKSLHPTRPPLRDENEGLYSSHDASSGLGADNICILAYKHQVFLPEVVCRPESTRGTHLHGCDFFLSFRPNSYPAPSCPFRLPSYPWFSCLFRPPSHPDLSCLFRSPSQPGLNPAFRL